MDCCIIYCELIESEAVCKRVLMNFRPRLLQKYKILLVQQELMRAQLFNYLCTSDFFHLPERHQKKLFKLSFQIVSLLKITDRVEQFIINLFRAQLNINPCIYRCFLQLIYLLISKNFADNQDRLIRIVQQVTHNEVILKQVKYQKIIINMYKLLYSQQRRVFDEANMLYYILIFTNNIDQSVQQECFEIIQQFDDFNQEQFETFLDIFSLTTSQHNLELCSSVLVKLLSHKFYHWSEQILTPKRFCQMSPMIQYFIAQSILIVQPEIIDITRASITPEQEHNNLILLASICKILTAMLNEQLSPQMIYFRQCTTMVLFMLMTGFAPYNYDYYNNIAVMTQTVFKSCDQKMNSMMLLSYFNAICPQYVSSVVIPCAKYDMMYVMLQRNVNYFTE